jgi:hypothetical protein
MSDRSSGNPSGGRRVASAAFGPYHMIGISPKGRRFKNTARAAGSEALGAAPGVAAGGVGAGMVLRDLKNIDNATGKGKIGALGAGLLAAGIPTAAIGGHIGRQKNLTTLNRRGMLEKEKVGKSATVSAFGVNHGEEVSKLSMAPIKSGFKAMRFGKAPSVPKVMGRSYKAGIKNGMSKPASAIQGLKTGFQHSPGTALAAGGLATGGAGAVGYGLGHRKD